MGEEMSGEDLGGVRFVDLAPLSDPALVPQAVASVFGVREEPGRDPVATLQEHLHAQKSLLILDNCEHLIEACAQFVDVLLNSCSGLRVLATSREVLGVAGETNWPVSPLALPDAGQRLPPVEELARYEAIRLFLERARSRLPDFGLTEENARGVVEICRKLDGIPLGIQRYSVVLIPFVGTSCPAIRDPLAGPPPAPGSTFANTAVGSRRRGVWRGRGGP
jgi:non-specific serine/threonine protein kinase